MVKFVAGLIVASFASFASAAEVELTGPQQVSLETRTFYNWDGEAFRIDIDKRSFDGCFSGLHYEVTDLGRNKFFVKIEAGPVPAVMCMPHMMRRIETGISIDVPARDSFSYAEVIIHNTLPIEGETRVEVVAAEGIQVTGGESYPATADIYTYVESDGQPFVLDIDRTTIHACFKSIGHSAHAIKSGYLVEVEPLAVPAVVCRPEQYRNIEIGTSIEVPAGRHGYTYGELYVIKGFPGYGNVTVRGE